MAVLDTLDSKICLACVTSESPSCLLSEEPSFVLAVPPVDPHTWRQKSPAVNQNLLRIWKKRNNILIKLIELFLFIFILFKFRRYIHKIKFMFTHSVAMLTSGGLPVAFWTTKNNFVTISITCPVWKTKSPFFLRSVWKRHPVVSERELEASS